MEAFEICYKAIEADPEVFWLIIAYKLFDEGFEAWLGSTDKVKAGSKAEAMWDGLKYIINLFKKEKK